MNAKKINKRIVYMDIFRGMGIILMIMGHVGFGKIFDHFIHAFHMPMFFFISGFFYNNSISLGAFIKNKAKKLLIPYISFGLGHYLLWCLLHWNEFTLEPLVHIFFENTDGLPIAGALWFLTALFFTELIYFVIDKMCKEKFIQNIFILWGIIFGHLFTRVLPVQLPYALDAALVGLGLFHIAVLLRNENTIKRCLQLSKVKWLGGAIGITGLIFLNGYINMRTGNYAIIPLFWINAVGAIMIGLNLAKYLETYSNIYFIKRMMYIGKNSIVYVCLNQVVLLVVKKLMNIVFQQIHIPDFIIGFMVLSISFFLLRICSNIINNTKLRVFIGKL